MSYVTAKIIVFDPIQFVNGLLMCKIPDVTVQDKLVCWSIL